MVEGNGIAIVGEQETARVIAGLVAGRIVNYVMSDHTIRPLIVVNAFDGTGLVNGVLLFDGLNDAGNFPVPLVAGHSGHLPLCAAWIAGAKFDDGKASIPGTWDWPAKQPCVAAAVDAAALETAMLPIIERLMDTINAKLDATVQACNDLVESAFAPPFTIGKDCYAGNSAGCPTCDSPNPELHPAMNLGGEVQPCRDAFHSPAPEVTASATVETPADVAHNGAPVNEPEFGREPMTGTDLDAETTKTPELPS